MEGGRLESGWSVGGMKGDRVCRDATDGTSAN